LISVKLNMSGNYEGMVSTTTNLCLFLPHFLKTLESLARTWQEPGKNLARTWQEPGKKRKITYKRIVRD